MTIPDSTSDDDSYMDEALALLCDAENGDGPEGYPAPAVRPGDT